MASEPLDLTRLPASPCTHCGHLCTAATSLGEASWKPSEGSLTLCIGCGQSGVFNADLSVRWVPISELSFRNRTDRLAFMKCRVRLLRFITGLN